MMIESGSKIDYCLQMILLWWQIQRRYCVTQTYLGSSMVMSQPVTQQAEVPPRSSCKVFTDDQAVAFLLEQEDGVCERSVLSIDQTMSSKLFSGRVMSTWFSIPWWITHTQEDRIAGLSLIPDCKVTAVWQTSIHISDRWTRTAVGFSDLPNLSLPGQGFEPWTSWF